MSKFRHHKYTYSKPFSSARHQWELVGPEGGIHFHVSLMEGYDASCGLEFHHAARSGYGKGEAPHHLNCPLLGEPCWHDGTSLYARETLWPEIQHMLNAGNHEGVFRVLEYEYDKHFNRLKEESSE